MESDETTNNYIFSEETTPFLPVNLKYLTKYNRETQQVRVSSNNFYKASTFIYMNNFRPTSKLLILQDIITDAGQ